MPIKNSSNFIPHIYQGKHGGIKNNKATDVLTRKLVHKGEDGKKAVATAVFERAGNKTLWQKIKNTFGSSQTALVKDAVVFLESRDIKKDDAKRMIKDIKSPYGINAQAFEKLLNDHGIATDLEKDRYTPQIHKEGAD